MEASSTDNPPPPEAEQQDQSDDAGGVEEIYDDAPRHRQTPRPREPSVPRRIHILGTGSIGKLVAHSLRGIPNPPPVSLIFHRYKLLEAWEESRKIITIQDDGFREERGGFDVELMPEVRRQHGLTLRPGEESPYGLGLESEGVKPHQVADVLRQERQREDAAQPGQDGGPAVVKPSSDRPGKGDYAISSDPITNLIVTTKAPLTVAALTGLRHRLSCHSTICFLQNGMGVVDEVNKQLFPREEDRPNYIQGIITHGVNVPPEVAERDPFYAVHAGHGTIALGLLPRDDAKKQAISDDAAPQTTTTTSSDANTNTPQISQPTPTNPLHPPSNANSPTSPTLPPTARHLLRTLTRTPTLAATGLPATELHQQQLEKLAVNSILNPLTALLDARNAALLYNFPLTRTLRLLLAETSLVIRSLPELRGLPNIAHRFSAARLETLVISVAHRTRDNISSMLADVRRGRRTEVEFINGYIVRRGEEVGVKCVVNFAIMEAVKGKVAVVGREGFGEVRVEGHGGRGGFE